MYKALKNYHEDEDDMREYAFALAMVAADNKKIDPRKAFYQV
jgi:hypothetical protein